MKKAILSMLLFLTLCAVTQAQGLKIVKQAVGTGGFINQKTSVGTMSGIFGQSMVGRYNTTIDGKQHTMYLGFWNPFPFNATSIIDEVDAGKSVYNYPNPVMDATTFMFNLNEAAYVTINVYNNLGAQVATVATNQMCSQGQNSIQWNIRNNEGVGSGAYSYDVQVTPVAIATGSNTYSLRGILMIAR
ncbi:MAG: hypothetical protein LBO69_07800 [Ignavibacteria bacterium]|jgi:hypothetical protein|nr:hypothetical protein [Ignavibacteria bacterium]